MSAEHTPPNDIDPARPTAGSGIDPAERDAVDALRTGAAEGGGDGSHSLSVGAGVLASRILGLIRDRVLAHLLGIGPWRDLYEALFRGANLLQNLLGEQALSAAFLPIYSRFRERGTPEKARRFALAVLLQLTLLVIAIVLVCWWAAPLLMRILYPGWAGDADRLANLVTGLRILLPMSGILVLSAWCLAILNSHGRFFLPYVAPVSWNLAVLSALGAAAYVASRSGSVMGLNDPAAQRQIVFWACWGGLVGGALQFLVQWFPARQCLDQGASSESSPHVGAGATIWRSEGIRRFRQTFGPALLGRGVVQLSSSLDQILASFLAAGALAALSNAFRVYFLAATMVATTIVVVELPTLSRLLSANGDRPSDAEDESSSGVGSHSLQGAELALERLRKSFRDATFLTVPTAVGLVALAVPIVATLFQTGQFGRPESWLVGSVLAVYAVALVPSTASRLVQNLLFAAGNTATPAKVSLLRLVVSVAVGVPSMLWLDRLLVSQVFSVPSGNTLSSSDLRLGACGLALGSVVGAWCELMVLSRRCGKVGLAPALPWSRLLIFLPLAAVSAAVAAAAWTWLGDSVPTLLLGPLLVVLFAGIYLALAALLNVPELTAVWQRWRPRRSR